MMLRLLLEQASPHLDAVTDEYSTAVLLAAKADHPRCCSALVRAGAAVTVRRHDGTTVLHFAAQHGHAALCQQLLVAGAEPDLRAHDNATPLLLAASEGQYACVQLLLSLGVCQDTVFSPAFTSSKHTQRIAEALNGFTARDFAIERGDRKLEQLLAEAGGAAPCKEPKSIIQRVVVIGNPALGEWLNIAVGVGAQILNPILVHHTSHSPYSTIHHIYTHTPHPQPYPYKIIPYARWGRE
jgi:ankyrin repeat protein